MEALSPGTFQANMDSMFKLNGIPVLKFPTNIVTENIKERVRDIECHTRNNNKANRQGWLQGYVIGGEGG